MLFLKKTPTLNLDFCLVVKETLPLPLTTLLLFLIPPLRPCAAEWAGTDPDAATCGQEGGSVWAENCKIL